METPATHSFLGMPAVVRSKAMLDLLALVERVARTNATVLITGETGSGKEMVARATHHYSLRHTKPWVDVNCAALPEHLMESELFGYEKGAFTGASSIKQGLFELADKGTLFLDEIGELDRKMQVKLLRVLDGTPYYRLGGVRKITVDVRILAATNLNLEEAVEAGTFRKDLYHRLSQIHLKVPPLRERPEDIAGLAEFFLWQQNPGIHFSPAAIESLHRCPWLGNVRELRNLVSRALVFARGSSIEPWDLPLQAAAPEAKQDNDAVFSLERIEREMIFKALAESSGHHQKAATLLGISRRTLSRKLKIYGATEAIETSVA
jgi:Response regulator containing CheY-like receiver, AAA-type ATPase, and DNA-binding domains